MKKILYLFIVVSVFYLFYRQLTAKSSPPASASCQPDMIVYWGEGCSHCEVVKDYVNNNPPKDYCLIFKEVFKDQQNFSEMKKSLSDCPEYASADQVDVPLAFLTREKKCLLGDQPIIDHLSSLIQDNSK